MQSWFQTQIKSMTSSVKCVLLLNKNWPWHLEVRSCPGLHSVYTWSSRFIAFSSFFSSTLQRISNKFNSSHCKPNHHTTFLPILPLLKAMMILWKVGPLMLDFFSFLFCNFVFYQSGWININNFYIGIHKR